MTSDEPFICLVCSASFYQRSFEAKLINDEQFCPGCWTEIMTTQYQADVDSIVLPQMVIAK